MENCIRNDAGHYGYLIMAYGLVSAHNGYKSLINDVPQRYQVKFSTFLSCA